MIRVPRFIQFAAITALCASGCRREDAHVALQPRQTPAEPAAEAPPSADAAGPDGAAPPAQERPHPHLTWTLPAGWVETGPGQMSAASFTIKSDAGDASVNITPLPNLTGKEALVVNMWREQVGAAPLDPAEALKALSDVDVAGGKGKLFEISGTNGGKPMQIVTAMAQAGNASWFYKLSGSEPVVKAQKPAFLEFLKSVRMQEDGAEAAPAAPAHP